VPDWIGRETSGAPATLRGRVLEHHGGADPTPDALARGGQRALARVLGRTGDRSVALDLLAADALVTLALLAQAQAAPERLGAFAAGVLRDVSPSS
jgi:hypothetical protein